MHLNCSNSSFISSLIVVVQIFYLFMRAVHRSKTLNVIEKEGQKIFHYFLQITWLQSENLVFCNDNLLYYQMPNTCGQVINTWRQLVCCDCTSVNMSWNQWEMHTEVPHHMVRLPIIVDGVWRLAEPEAIDYGQCVNTSHKRYEMAKYLESLPRLCDDVSLLSRCI